MEKNIISAVVMIVLLFSISSVGFPQWNDIADQVEDGKTIVEKSNLMIEKAKMIKNSDLKDKKMVEQ